MVENSSRIQEVYSLTIEMMDRNARNLQKIAPALILVEDFEFWSSIACVSGGFHLYVTQGIEQRINRFWTLGAKKNFLKATASHTRLSPDRQTQLSLMFLLHHELNHIFLSHFHLIENAESLDEHSDILFDLVERSSRLRCSINAVPEKFRNHVSLCLELQADHESIDTMLGAHNNVYDRHDLRQRVLAIAGVMTIIELEDFKNNTLGQTHPKAATRIFQLFGHLTEMPLLRAQIENNASLIPSEDELQAFAHEVTIPCFFDAIQLAQAADATSIADDLGRPKDFFKDLEIAKLGDPSRYGELKTQGAQEWAKLWPCNEALKPILGGHFTN